MYDFGYLCRSANDVGEVFLQHRAWHHNVTGTSIWAHKMRHYADCDTIVIYISKTGRAEGWDTIDDCNRSTPDLELREPPSQEVFNNEINIEDILNLEVI